MKNPLSILKSSFHDIRCCDETVTTNIQTGVTTAWRALVSSLSCLLTNGANTGYVHCQTLEQFDTATNQPTGVYKPNTPSDPDHVADYLDTNMCAISQEQPTTALLYAANNCSGILGIELTNETTLEVINLDVNPSQSITQTIPVGLYKIIMHCSQTQPASPGPALHVLQIVNSVTKVLATEALQQYDHVTTNININVHPTTQDLS